MPADLDPRHYDPLAEAGTLALRAFSGRIMLDLEHRQDLFILRHMFMELTIKEAVRVQACLSAAIVEALEQEAEMAIPAGKQSGGYMP